MQVLPSPHLSHLVKHFLILEREEALPIAHRFFPDGNPGIVFHYKTPFATQARSFIYGQASSFRQMNSAGSIGMLIIVLQPYGAYTLLGIPAHELTDEMIPLTDLRGTRAQEAGEQICMASDPFHRIRLAEDWITQQIDHHGNIVLPVQQAVAMICQHRGLASIHQVTSQLYITERQLERSFREMVGLSPKSFSGIIRLQTALKSLQCKTPDTNITETVYDCGYYDQAHFIRVCRKHTGLTPREYLFKANALALNLVQLPTA
jgi:AraC-like DNA-binding protein